jgi:hypothetical protein
MMKLVGTKYGCDRNFYWEQTRNATEYIIRAIKRELAAALIRAGVSKAILDQVHASGFLESCGAESVVNSCANLLGDNLPGLHAFENIFPGWPTGPQLDDITMLAFSEPRLVNEMAKAIAGWDGSDLMENRFMQLHPVIAWILFGIRAEWKRGRIYDEIYAAAESGNSAGILIPSHYVSAGVVDQDTGELRIKDSWGGRKPEWKGDGFLQPLGRQEFAGVDQTVIYFKPAA